MYTVCMYSVHTYVLLVQLLVGCVYSGNIYILYELIVCICCSVCFVIVCLPEEDPPGSKRCNGCFDFKVLCIRSLF